MAGEEANPNTRAAAAGPADPYSYKIALNEGDYKTAQPHGEGAFRRRPGVEGRSRPMTRPGTLTRFYDLFVNFLLIVGLSSLLVGGVGISNAVSAYIQERQRSIATLRSLGATGARILVHFFTQVGLLSLVGIVIGLVIGAALTAAALPILGGILGVDLPPSVESPSLVTALGFRRPRRLRVLLSAARQAQKLRPAMLFRTVGTSVQSLKTREYLDPLRAPAAAARRRSACSGSPGGPPATSISSSITRSAWSRPSSCCASPACLLQLVLRALPAVPNRDVRNAFRGIYRPGSPAPVVIMSLGLGLAMLLVIVILSANLRDQLMGQVQKDAPTFVATDLFDDEVVDLQNFLKPTGVITNFQHSPMIRAAVTKVNGVPSDRSARQAGPAGRSRLHDRHGRNSDDLVGRSAERIQPSPSGQWWASDYNGPPLVSLRDQDAHELGLKVGDTHRADAVRRDASRRRVANLRDFQFQNGLNFLVTASPGTFDDFPGTNLATIKAVEGKEKDLERALAKRYPDITFLPGRRSCSTRRPASSASSRRR